VVARWRSRGAAAIGCAGALAAASAASAGDGSGDRADPVTCSTNVDRHRLDVRLRDRREVFRVPPEIRRQINLPGRIVSETPSVVRIERRIDEITVIDETPTTSIGFPSVAVFDSDTEVPEEGSVRSCGAPPTVTGTDSVRLRLGTRSESADMFLDLRYGRLEPGFGDEGDGAPEIELDARLGSGMGLVRMTRGTDEVAVVRPPAGTTGPVKANLNAGEAVPDSDLVLGRQSILLIDGLGGNDRLGSAGGPSDLDAETGVLLAGSQGEDLLTGGRGTDVLDGGAGPDVIEAGAGADGVLADGRASDRIDCGPGFDLLIFVRDVHRVRNCERRISLRDVFENLTPRKLAERPGLLRKLRRSGR
jgi:hypothetical protein